MKKQKVIENTPYDNDIFRIVLSSAKEFELRTKQKVIVQQYPTYRKFLEKKRKLSNGNYILYATWPERELCLIEFGIQDGRISGNVKWYDSLFKKHIIEGIMKNNQWNGIVTELDVFGNPAHKLMMKDDLRHGRQLDSQILSIWENGVLKEYVDNEDLELLERMDEFDLFRVLNGRKPKGSDCIEEDYPDSQYSFYSQYCRDKPRNHTSLNFSMFHSLTHLTITNSRLINVHTFSLIGLNLLESVTIHGHSFAYFPPLISAPHNVLNPTPGAFKTEVLFANRKFEISKCESLESIDIGIRSFTDFVSFSLTELNKLKSFVMSDSREEEFEMCMDEDVCDEDLWTDGSFLWCEDFVLKDLPSIETILIFSRKSFAKCKNFSLINLPSLTSLAIYGMCAFECSRSVVLKDLPQLCTIHLIGDSVFSGKGSREMGEFTAENVPKAEKVVMKNKSKLFNRISRVRRGVNVSEVMVKSVIEMIKKEGLVKNNVEVVSL